MEKTWFRLELRGMDRSDVEATERLYGILYGLGAVGLVEPGERSAAKDPGESPAADLVAYFRASRDESERILERVRASGRWRAAILPEPEVDWAERSRAAFRPTRPTPRLVLHPPWSRPRIPKGSAGLSLYPGRVFGLGTHASTILCLETIDSAGTRGAHLLDVGTGTGVLAMAAARFGAALVVAIESDWAACLEAASNIRANGLQGRVRLACATPAALRRGGFGIVVSNLDRKEILAGMEDLLGCLDEDGELRLAGILQSDEAALREAAARAGAGVAEVHRREDWILMRLRRGGRVVA